MIPFLLPSFLLFRQGIHNIFIVIPQFLVTGFAAILFALVDPQKPLLPDHRAPVAPGPILNGTLPAAAVNAVVSRGKEVLENLLLDNSTRGKVELNDSSHPDSVVYIFRLVLFFTPCFLWILGSFYFYFYFFKKASAAWLLLWHLFYVGGLQERYGIDKAPAPPKRIM